MYTYYDNEEMQNSKSYTWTDNNWHIASEEQYNQNGKTVLVDEYDYKTEETKITRTTYEYDDKDKQTQQLVQIKNGENSFVNHIITSTSYNEQGDITVNTVSQWLNNAWYQTGCEEYSYNAYGNNTQKIETVCKNTLNAETNLVETMQTQTTTDYVYDVWNQPVTDEALISRGYTFQNGDNDYKMYFSDDSEKGVLLVLKGGTEIKLFPNVSKTVGQSEKATIDKKQTDVSTYLNAYGSDTALRFIPQLNGIKDEIILEKYNGKNSFEFTLDVGENTAAINSKGEIEIIDNNREIIQTFAAPFAYDAVGNDGDKDEHYTDCTYSLEKKSDGIYTLSINVPEEFLTSENTVYPVTIDPVTEHLAVTTDAGVYSAKADNTYGSEESACVGKTGTSEYDKGRAMFYFRVPTDIKSYAKISSAKLWLREVTGRTATTYVRPYLIILFKQRKTKTFSRITARLHLKKHISIAMIMSLNQHK